MRRAVSLAIGMAVLVGFVAFVYTMNPTDVDFQPWPATVWRMPLGLLLVLTLVDGILIAVVAVAIQHLNRRFANWGEHRRARREAEVVELRESGLDLAWRGDLERSRSTLKKAWRREPSDIDTALALAASYADTSEYDAARQTLEAAVAETPNDPDLRCALGDVLVRLGDAESAVRMFESVRVQHPAAPRVLARLRRLYESAGRWREAAEIQERSLREMESAVNLQDERRRLLSYRLGAAQDQSDPSERIPEIEAILAEDRDYAEAVDALGTALLESNRGAEAVRLWEKAFKRNPRPSLAEHMLQAASSSRDRDRVVSLIERHPGELGADTVHLLRARAALLDGRLEVAQQELDGIADPQSESAILCRADLYRQRGDFERAWETVQTLLVPPESASSSAR